MTTINSKDKHEKIISSLDERKQLDWMVHSKTSISEHDAQMRKLLADEGLLGSNIYKFNPDRIRWVYLWLTTDCEVNSETYRARLKFLQHNLHNERYFNAFYTKKQVFNELNNDPNLLIFRLSSNNPGHITLSYKEKDKIYHIRYKIDKDTTNYKSNTLQNLAQNFNRSTIGTSE